MQSRLAWASADTPGPLSLSETHPSAQVTQVPIDLWQPCPRDFQRQVVSGGVIALMRGEYSRTPRSKDGCSRLFLWNRGLSTCVSTNASRMPTEPCRTWYTGFTPKAHRRSPT